MNREVFLSILAMDSYQRGYSPGIDEVTGVKIGKATICRDSTQSPETADGEAASFYALSYTLDSVWAGLAAGTKVISYRGTDFDLGIQLARDVWNGWNTFLQLGSPTQFDLARSFYTAVTGADFRVGNQAAPANTIVTGHSLGGALAANDNRPARRIAA